MRKKINMLLVIILSVLLVAGCSLNNGARVYDNEKMIVENFNTYNLVKSKQSMSDNHEGIQFFKYNTGSAEKMEGMGTVWEFMASEDTDVNLTYQITVSAGKAKLVLISPDDSLTILAEFTADVDMGHESTDTFKAMKGKNRIKLVGGKGTKIEYEITADKGDMKAFGD